MTPPELVALILALVMLIFGGLALGLPDGALKVFRGLYRSPLAGYALTTLALVWAGALLLGIGWGGFEHYKQLTYIAVPVVIVLLCVFVDDLLMPRALGGLFLMIPTPILSTFRWHPSPFRYLPIVLAYVIAIAGFVLIMNPYMYRKTFECVGKTVFRFRATGFVLAVLGAMMLGLAASAF